MYKHILIIQTVRYTFKHRGMYSPPPSLGGLRSCTCTTCWATRSWSCRSATRGRRLAPRTPTCSPSMEMLTSSQRQSSGATFCCNTFFALCKATNQFLTRLVDMMKKNKGVGAACGRIHPTGSGYMPMYQTFEYAVKSILFNY